MPWFFWCGMVIPTAKQNMGRGVFVLQSGGKSAWSYAYPAYFQMCTRAVMEMSYPGGVP